MLRRWQLWSEEQPNRLFQAIAAFSSAGLLVLGTVTVAGECGNDPSQPFFGVHERPTPVGVPEPGQAILWIDTAAERADVNEDWSRALDASAGHRVGIYVEIHNHSDSALENLMLRAEAGNAGETDLPVEVFSSASNAAEVRATSVIVLTELGQARLAYVPDSFEWTVGPPGGPDVDQSPIRGDDALFNSGISLGDLPACGWDGCLIQATFYVDILSAD